MTTGERVLAAVERGGFRTTHHETAEDAEAEPFDTGMRFTDEGTPTTGETAERITVPYSNYKTGLFTYDAEEGLYYAEEYGKPYIDGNDQSQIAVTNVLILHVTYINTGDSYGHLHIQFDEGKGWYASGGYIEPITWTKAGRDEPLRYFTEDGEELEMNRGKTYVNFLPTNREPAWEAAEGQAEG